MKGGQRVDEQGDLAAKAPPTTCDERGIGPVKGDRVETVVDAGDATRTYEVVASGAGRRVETAVRRGVVEVSEVTRWGSPTPFRQWGRVRGAYGALHGEPGPRAGRAADPA